MGAPLNKLWTLLAGVFLILAISGCGSNGKVFVSFHWKDGAAPNTFTTTIPDVPSNISTLNRAQPYQTLPGTFTVNVVYLPGPVAYTKTYTLQSGVAIIGEEDFYYDIWLSAQGISLYGAP